MVCRRIRFQTQAALALVALHIISWLTQ